MTGPAPAPDAASGPAHPAPARTPAPAASAGSFTIPSTHPSLPGHFPGRPIVPGVVLLDHLIAAAEHARPGRRVAGLPAVKFLRPVRSGEEVVIHLQDGTDRIGASCTVAGQEVLRGTLLLAPALPAPPPPVLP